MQSTKNQRAAFKSDQEIRSPFSQESERQPQSMFSLLEKELRCSLPGRILAVLSSGMYRIANFSVLRTLDRELFMPSQFLLTVKRWPLAEKVTTLASSSGIFRIVSLSNGMIFSLA